MIGYGSAAVNDQLIPVPVKAAYSPIAFGSYFTGPSWPRNGVYNVPPVIPSPALASSMAPAAYGASGAMGAGTGPTATDQNGNPFHWRRSPVLWGLAFVAIALIMLHTVHFK